MMNIQLKSARSIEIAGFCAALAMTAALTALADHTDHPEPGYPTTEVRCTTESQGRWIGLLDTHPGADTRTTKRSVISMCQQLAGPAGVATGVECEMHAACSTEPYALTAYVCSASTHSEPSRVFSAWATSEALSFAQQVVTSQCVSHAYTIRDRLHCENTGKNCQPALRAGLESTPAVVAPLPPPLPVARMVCTAQAFGLIASSEPFVPVNEIVVSQQKDQAILRCVGNFRYDSIDRRQIAERECRASASCNR